MTRTIRIATRGSTLARIQAESVGAELQRQCNCPWKLIILKTTGDRIVDQPLRESEGKGFFTREIEESLLNGEADLAVHSLKDLPTESVSGLETGAYPNRAAPGDLLLIRPIVAGRVAGGMRLPPDAKVGTSSNRRRMQIQKLQYRLTICDIRGNVPTRLQRLRDGQFDAIILAKAGLDRLSADISDLTVIPLLPHGFLPAPGQGALAVQIRTDDEHVRQCVTKLDHEPTRRCVEAERLLLMRSGGGCAAPLGCLAEIGDTGNMAMRACWFAPDGTCRTCEVTGTTPNELSVAAWDRLQRQQNDQPNRSVQGPLCGPFPLPETDTRTGA